MTNLSIFLSSLAGLAAGVIVVLAELPIYFIFAIVFVAAMIEAKKIEKKMYPIASNLLASSISGWGASFGVKYYKPEWFESDARIFVMFITTLFAYSIVVYLLKNEIVSQFVEKYLKKKNDDSSGDN